MGVGQKSTKKGLVVFEWFLMQNIEYCKAVTDINDFFPIYPTRLKIERLQVRTFVSTKIKDCNAGVNVMPRSIWFDYVLIT